jgi:hypothetical protein
MLNRRFHLPGLFAVLVALMAQLGVGASVPRIDPVAGVGALCHAEDDAGGKRSKAPTHPADCLVCPLCAAVNAAAFALVPVLDSSRAPAVAVVLKSELPPPATAPPAPKRPPSQPRAPPIFS